MRINRRNNKDYKQLITNYLKPFKGAYLKKTILNREMIVFQQISHQS